MADLTSHVSQNNLSLNAPAQSKTKQTGALTPPSDVAAIATHAASAVANQEGATLSSKAANVLDGSTSGLFDALDRPLVLSTKKTSGVTIAAHAAVDLSAGQPGANKAAAAAATARTSGAATDPVPPTVPPAAPNVATHLAELASQAPQALAVLNDPHQAPQAAAYLQGFANQADA